LKAYLIFEEILKKLAKGVWENGSQTGCSESACNTLKLVVSRGCEKSYSI
jgi:hypothetical protein